MSGKVFYFGWRVKKKGIWFWAKIRINSLRTENGTVVEYRRVWKETSYNAIYSYRVKRVSDEYLNLFNNSFIGIFKFRLNDAKFLLLNEKAREMLNMSDNEDGYFSDLFATTTDYHGFLKEVVTNDSKNIE